jgi:hypothetical protein
VLNRGVVRRNEHDAVVGVLLAPGNSETVSPVRTHSLSVELEGFCGHLLSMNEFTLIYFRNIHRNDNQKIHR